MGEESLPGAGGALHRLRTTLEAALEMTRQLKADDLLGRLLQTFHAMPADDRPVIVAVLEREVRNRLLSRGTESPVGQSTRPNPNARLYIRAHESGFDRRIFERDEMVIANVRAMRVASVIRNVPDVYATWKDAMREAMMQVDETTRAIVEGLVHDVLACIAEARDADGARAAELAAMSDGRGERKRS